MDKVILISETAKETRIAIQEDGELVELYVEKPERTRMIGNIYKGKVENVIPGIQAAFVDIATPHNAFLPFSEINNPQNLMTMMGDLSDNEEEDEEDEVDLKPKHTRPGGVDSANLQKGQDILVEVRRNSDVLGEIATKDGTALAYSATTASHLDMLKIDSASMKRLHDAYPDVYKRLETYISKRASQTASRLKDINK